MLALRLGDFFLAWIVVEMVLEGRVDYEARTNVVDMFALHSLVLDFFGRVDVLGSDARELSGNVKAERSKSFDINALT